MTHPRITAARDLLLEATTAEVVGAFAAADVGHIFAQGAAAESNGCFPAATSTSPQTSMFS